MHTFLGENRRSPALPYQLGGIQVYLWGPNPTILLNVPTDYGDRYKNVSSVLTNCFLPGLGNGGRFVRWESTYNLWRLTLSQYHREKYAKGESQGAKARNNFRAVRNNRYPFWGYDGLASGKGDI